MSRFLNFVFLAFYCCCCCCCCRRYGATVECSSAVLDVFSKFVNLCRAKNNTNLVNCVKERSLIALDNAYRSENDIALISNWISLVRTDDTPIQERSGKILLSDIENQSAENKSIIVDNLIVRRIIDFLESRAISVKIPIVAFDVFNILEDDEKEEGRGKGSDRGKKDKGGSMLIMGGLFAGTMMAMKLAAVAALAGKALMASMMATLLAALAALSKKGGGHGASYEVINVPHGHHARRSMVEAAGYANQKYHNADSSYADQPLELDPI